MSVRIGQTGGHTAALLGRRNRNGAHGAAARRNVRHPCSTLPPPALEAPTAAPSSRCADAPRGLAPAARLMQECGHHSVHGIAWKRFRPSRCRLRRQGGRGSRLSGHRRRYAYAASHHPALPLLPPIRLLYRLPVGQSASCWSGSGRQLCGCSGRCVHRRFERRAVYRAHSVTPRTAVHAPREGE